MRTKCTAFGLLALCGTTPLGAHAGDRVPGAGPWWTYWSFDPLIMASFVLLAGYYAVGWRERQRSLPAPAATGRVRGQAWAFASAVAALALALLSPIDVLAGDLLWVHMVQHMVLMNLAAPLFVLGAPLRTMVWLLPRTARRRLGRGMRRVHAAGWPRYFLWQPLLLWGLYGAVLWIWHLPRFYEAALADPWVHDAQHLMFFAVAVLFWRVLFDPIGRLRLSRGLAVIYLFTTSLHATLLGVFMVLAPRLWYETYAVRTLAWGMVPLEDQQLAGYIMWMPACMAYAAVAAIVFARWLQEEPVQPDPTSTPRAG